VSDFCRVSSVIFLILHVKFVSSFHKNTKYLKTHHVYKFLFQDGSFSRFRKQDGLQSMSLIE